MLTSHMLRIYQKHIYTHNIHHAYTTQAANLSKTYLYHSGHTTNQPVVIPHLIYSEDLTSGKYHLPCISTTVIPHLRWRSYHSGHSVVPQTKPQLTYGHTTLSLKLLNFCKTKLQLNKRSQLFIINTVWYDLPTWSYSAQRTCAASALNWSSLLGLLFYVFANRTARSLGCLATLWSWSCSSFSCASWAEEIGSGRWSNIQKQRREWMDGWIGVRCCIAYQYARSTHAPLNGRASSWTIFLAPDPLRKTWTPAAAATSGNYPRQYGHLAGPASAGTCGLPQATRAHIDKRGILNTDNTHGPLKKRLQGFVLFIFPSFTTRDTWHTLIHTQSHIHTNITPLGFVEISVVVVLLTRRSVHTWAITWT